MFRRRPVCREPLQEWSHVFGQRGGLRLRLQVGFHRGPLWKGWGGDVRIIIVNSLFIWGVSAANLPFCFHDADQTLCTLEKNTGCSQFCKPGYTSYECSCARGWKLSRTDRNKCEPAGTSISSIKVQLKIKCIFSCVKQLKYLLCKSLIMCFTLKKKLQTKKGESKIFW